MSSVLVAFLMTGRVTATLFERLSTYSQSSKGARLVGQTAATTY